MGYPGGKAKTFAQVVNRLPKHDVYIEPFLGKGSVLRAKKPSQYEVGIDLDARVLGDLELADRGVRLLQEDGLKFLQDYPFTGDEVVYCDPPYLPCTRKARKVYKFELTEADHIQLISIVKSINARVLISGYASELYNHALDGWHKHVFQAKAHDGVREEVLWFNFDEPCELHDYRYLGRDYRQRQTIKRRLERIQNRIQTLSAQEQYFLRTWLDSELLETCS